MEKPSTIPIDFGMIRNATMTYEIREATNHDAKALLDIYQPFIVESPITFETEPLSLTQFEKRLLEYKKFAPWLVYESSGEILGYAYASKHRERAAYRYAVEVSIYVSSHSYRKGVGRILYRELFSRLKAMGFKIALAGITLPNEPSVKFHESLGFEKVAHYPKIGFKLGAWYDVGWWQYSIR